MKFDQNVPAIVISAPKSVAELAHIANGEHTLSCAASTSALKHAIACGEALLAIKKQLPHGDFSKAHKAHRSAHLKINDRQVQKYMKLAKYKDEIAAFWPESINEAMNTVADLESVAKFLPGAGQRRVGRQGAVTIGIVGSAEHPGEFYIAAECPDFQTWVRTTLPKEHLGSHLTWAAMLINGHGGDPTEIDWGELESLETLDEKGRCLYFEDGEIITSDYAFVILEPDFILGRSDIRAVAGHEIVDYLTNPHESDPFRECLIRARSGGLFCPWGLPGENKEQIADPFDDAGRPKPAPKETRARSKPDYLSVILLRAARRSRCQEDAELIGKLYANQEIDRPELQFLNDKLVASDSEA